MPELAIDSFPNLLAHLAAEDVGSFPVQDWQRELKPGDAFLQVHPTGKAIYGVVLDAPENADRALYDRVIEKGFRYVRLHARGPGAAGYHGAVLVAEVDLPLTRAMFDRARDLGWPDDVREIVPGVVGAPMGSA